MILLEDLQSISPQTAKDRNLFGPVYHGTTSDKLEKITSAGFNITVGHERSGDVSHGYQASDYYAGIPAPIHHLGFGVYFTTVKSIAKQFGYGNTEIGPYFLDAPNMAIINFGAPRTMMKWWLENGYDYKKSPETLFGTGQTNLSLVRQERLRATQNMTNFLKAKYDGIWFKGKGMYRLLDGDQVVIFDPSKIYKVNKDMAQPGEIGSKVVAKVGIDPYGRGQIKVPIGTKGVILDKKKPTPEQKWAAGVEWLYHIKWEKGGSMWDVLDTWVEPYTKKRKISESEDSESYQSISKIDEQRVLREIERTFTHWKLGKYLKKVSDQRGLGLNSKYKFDVIAYRANLPDGHELLFTIRRLRGSGIGYVMLDINKNKEYPWTLVIPDDSKIKESIDKKDYPYYPISKEQELSAINQIEKKLNGVTGKTLHKIDEERHVTHPGLHYFSDLLTYDFISTDNKEPHRLFLSSARVGILFRIINLKKSSIVVDWRFTDSKRKINESEDKRPYHEITKMEELKAVDFLQRKWGNLIGKTLKKVSEMRKSGSSTFITDLIRYDAKSTDGRNIRFWLEKGEDGKLYYKAVSDKEWLTSWETVPFGDLGNPIDENIKKKSTYYHINRLTEQQCINYINIEWGDIIGKTLKKHHEIHHQISTGSYGNHFYDVIEYKAKDKDGRGLVFTIQPVHTGKIEMMVFTSGNAEYAVKGGLDEIPNVRAEEIPEKLNENKNESPYYSISKMEELQAINQIEKKWGKKLGKTLKKIGVTQKQHFQGGYTSASPKELLFTTDLIEYEALTGNKKIFFYIEKDRNGELEYYIKMDRNSAKIGFRSNVSNSTSTFYPPNINENEKSTEKFSYFPMTKLEEQYALHVLLKTRKEFKFKKKQSLKKIEDQRHFQGPGNFTDRVGYEVSIDGNKPFFLYLEKLQNDVIYFIKNPSSLERSEWDYIDPKKAMLKNWTQITTESKDSEPIYKGKFALTNIEEQQVINYINKLYHDRIKKTLKKFDERWIHQHHDVYVKRLIYTANYSGDRISIYIEKSPRGQISYSLNGSTTNIFGFYPPQNLNENSNNLIKIGDCRDENLVNQIFGHVSEFARQIELNGDNFDYEDIKVIYDPKKDIHSFWKRNTLKENDDDHWKSLEKTGYWGSKGAGAIILAKNSGRILLPYRSAHVEQPHTWGVWGGAIDAKEDPMAAVKREIAEEVGYNGIDMELIPLYVYNDSKVGFQYHNFLAIVPQEFIPKLNWETEKYKWVQFGKWPSPLHFGLKLLLKNDGDKIISIIEKLNLIPLKKEKIDREKYKAAIHIIRLTWEDMRKHGSYSNRFDYEHEFSHWVQNNSFISNLTEKYGMIFYPNAHEPGYEFQNYVEQILEMLEMKHNDRKLSKINKLDPLFLLKQTVRGKTWNAAKQSLRALSTFGGKWSGQVDDDLAEAVFNRLYRIALGETFFPEEEMSHYRPLSSYILTADSPQDEIAFFRYYNKGNKFPDSVKVYRGLNSPAATIRPGDHTSFDKGFARGYEAGKYGAVISAVLPSKDLLVKKMDVGSTELIYWPPGHKIKEVENVPTFKQFYNQWAFP